MGLKQGGHDSSVLSEVSIVTILGGRSVTRKVSGFGNVL